MTSHKTQAQIQGKNGEDIACSFLLQNGYRVVERNYRVSGGEIDLIAEKNHELAFVEVKTRSSLQFGYPEESVTRPKKLRLARAARRYLADMPHTPSYRFDIIAVYMPGGKTAPSIEHFENILDDILL